MPTYVYRCGECGPFDVVVPMAALTPARSCPTCAAEAGRVMTAPGLAGTSPEYTRARSVAEKSRSEPEVTTSVPPAARPAPVSRDPRHARLPRP